MNLFIFCDKGNGNGKYCEGKLNKFFRDNAVVFYIKFVLTQSTFKFPAAFASLKNHSFLGFHIRDNFIG